MPGTYQSHERPSSGLLASVRILIQQNSKTEYINVDFSNRNLW